MVMMVMSNCESENTERVAALYVCVTPSDRQNLSLWSTNMQ